MAGKGTCDKLSLFGCGNNATDEDDENSWENNSDDWHEHHRQPRCCKVSSHDQAQSIDTILES